MKIYQVPMEIVLLLIVMLIWTKMYRIPLENYGKVSAVKSIFQNMVVWNKKFNKP